MFLCSPVPQKIAENAIHILVNLSADKDVLETLAKNDKFIEVLFKRIVVSFPTLS